MAEIGRDELAARLEAVEARTETRFVELSGKLDRVVDSITGLTGKIGELEGKVEEVKTDNKSTRRTIIITVVAATITALAALWTTQSNLLDAFTAGISAGGSSETAPKP